jgi:P4 family phage/plasmid primase-like protien
MSATVSGMLEADNPEASTPNTDTPDVDNADAGNRDTDTGGSGGRAGDTSKENELPNVEEFAFMTLEQIDTAITNAPEAMTLEQVRTFLEPVLRSLAVHDELTVDVYVERLFPKLKATGIRKTVLRKHIKGALADPAEHGADDDQLLRGDHVELGARLLESLQSDGEALVFAEGALWRFDDDMLLWREVTHSEQARVVAALAGTIVVGGRFPLPLSVNNPDLEGTIRAARHQVASPAFFANAPSGLAFANKFVRFESGSIMAEPLGPDHRARTKLPFAYDANAAAPLFIRFMRQCLFGIDETNQLTLPFGDDLDPIGDTAIGLGKVRVLQEFVGVSMFGEAARYQRAVVCTGEGANGKGVLSKVVRAMLPKEACASIAPQDLQEDYKRAMLKGVRLNLVSELPENDIIDAESIKAVIAGDPITARLPFKDPFEFTPIAGHLYAANRLPATNDHSGGFWRRFIVIAWDRVFAESEQDKHLADKIISTELPGVAAFFVEGARCALARGAFDVPPELDAARADWRTKADTVRQFLDECTVESSSGSPNEQLRAGVAVLLPWTLFTDLYDAFVLWARRSGYKTMGKGQFQTRLKQNGLKGRHAFGGTFYKRSIKSRPSGLRSCPTCGAQHTPGFEMPLVRAF